ncbi:TlpA family protein disulfide reductase [Saccharicrinis fermentans]|uniref:Thiol-disulfide oxidoreductase ResA n=1 Tax=Saccharicrinis fermentans DSM 9555 = JCM 21142 TaxID=869213 RepID=W7Y787_9BACT|nr:TlpA disulfide reductase family protein [Saccharicrinis fermentans]GAF03543.1 thiol-disulfide oxidoreductase ResA [Saccharicrinis fermentans DSM 9555 = JCM 21142]
MKNIVILLLSTLILASCQLSTKKDYILLTGSIEDAPEKEFRLVKRSSPGRISVSLQEDGSFFCDTITFGTGRYVFTDGRNSAELYLIAGEEYNLTAVAKDFRNTAKLTGTNPDASNYLLTKIARIIRMRGDYAEFMSLKESEFIAKQSMLNESYQSYLDSFPNIPKEFSEMERKELYYYNLLTLIQYESRHRLYTKDASFKVSNDFDKLFEGVDYSNEKDYKQRGSYGKLISEHFGKKADELAEKEGLDIHFAKLKIFGNIASDYIKNDLLMAAAKYDIGRVDSLDQYYKAFVSVSTSTRNNESITEKYKALKKLAKGQPSPVFTGYINHAGGTTSLGDLKGKYVYIDVWATWCGPCLAEVPFLKKVEKQYHGRNIEFVSISIDVEKKNEAWRKLVINKELAGIQLRADKDWGSEFIASYEINSIPRFILIDPNGNIVASNAPRPSNPKLMELFSELNL